MVCKIVFCSEFPDIPDNAGKVTRRRRRRRIQAIAKRYMFHADAKTYSKRSLKQHDVVEKAFNDKPLVYP